MRPPAALILELAHGAMSTHILGALARQDIAEHLAAGPRGVADLATVTGTEPDLLDRLLFGPPLPGYDAHAQRLIGAAQAAMNLMLDAVGELGTGTPSHRPARSSLISLRRGSRPATPGSSRPPPCAPCSSGVGCTAS
jgi:hypothetical protein